MISKVLKATRENTVNNYLVTTCDRYLKTLELKCSCEEIEKMSKYCFTKILEQKLKGVAFKYLTIQKLKQTKI